MLRSWLARTALAGGIAVATVFGSTDAVFAVTNKTISLPGGRGTMTFIDDGDVFKICDTKADGHGVWGELWFQPWIGSEDVVLTIDDGGDAGCDKAGYNVGNDGTYQMLLCWNGPGNVCVWSGEFNE